MSNELKPCPFCGGKVKVSEREGYSGGEYITEIECNVCHMHVENLYNNDKTIDLWNTRQPAFDWKPIEELFKEDLNNWELVLLAGEIKNSLMEVGEQDNGDISLMFDNEFVSDYEDLEWVLSKGRYTRYALLIPPERR